LDVVEPRQYLLDRPISQKKDKLRRTTQETGD